ncbi:mechanosensitive ion channel protein [Roseobacter cerasinus]|uniref:Mechanosensitive ion channel protein n=2 Tax=Roseobacter cerasinus TaxID=2602289 RepID=A0A640VVR7_9RHOB|nr:mechanosensitive ion channel domain-containing protein [Roseobacter cerasinus]GFE52253.1 mechanosensitive ion channel protein [Roseobacter cerasinus]
METEEEPFAAAMMSVDEIWFLFTSFLQSIITPGWRQNQVLIVIGLAVVAYGLHILSNRVIENQVRAREGWSKWQLRMIVQIKRRMGLIWFAVLASALYLVMQQITWPSRSYFIGLAATLAIVWTGIAYAARLVRNRFLRRLVTWGLWIYATLYLVGVSDEVSEFLDDIALDVGDFHLSVLTLISAAVVIGVLFTVARLVSSTTASSIRRNEDISPSMQVLAVKAVQIFLYGFAFFMGVKAVGIDLTGLAVLSGAIGVGLGFGLQKVVSNLVSGVIILLDKSIKPGDVISLGETFGWINALGARYVSVVTRDGREYLIPNEDLITGQVVNWSHSNDFVRLDIYFGTSYGCDPHQVRKLAIEAATGVDRVLEHPKLPVCHIVGFGDSSVDYILRFWIRDPTGGLTNIRGNVYLALWDSFKAHNISIPFPQREVRLLEDEA